MPRTGETTNAYRILVRKCSLGRPRRRWEANVIGLLSCLMVDSGISSVELLGSATTGLSEAKD
jgi:hypothetical protein